jgi:hypothetical protein
MGAGFIQVKCPSCGVDQPARLSVALDPPPDFVQDTAPVTVTADLRAVNEHVKACAARRQ